MSNRRTRRNNNAKLALKLIGLAVLGMAVLSGLALCTNGSHAPAPLHDRITPTPAPAPSAYGFEVNPGDAQRESHYLAHLRSRGMTNQNTTTSDFDMIAIGYMVCTDFRNDESATYDTERPKVETYTEGDPVYASTYIDAATDILCKGEVDK